MNIAANLRKIKNISWHDKKTLFENLMLNFLYVVGTAA
jgi:hypothetical protein